MKGVYFNGKYIVKPGAYATIDAEGMFSFTPENQKIIALIGESSGGIPQEIMWFDNPESARHTLKGGDLLKACEKAWAPIRKEGKTGEGAHVIAVIRANNATKSTLDIGDGVACLAKVGVINHGVSNIGVISDDNFKTKGIYTGLEDKKIEIYIDSEGTTNYKTTTFRWRITGNSEWKGIKVPAYTAQNTGEVELIDGVSLVFSGGNFVYDDSYFIELEAEKKQRIVATIETKDYGLLTRKTSVKLGAGEYSGTNKLTVYNSTDNKYEIFNNIGATLFVSYSGNKSFAEVEIKHNSKNIAEKLIIRVGNDESTSTEVISINLTEDRFKRLKSVADYISSFDDFVCKENPELVSDIKSTDLDKTKVDITIQEAVLLAYWADMTKSVNAKSEYIKINREDTKTTKPTNFDFTNLSSGQDGELPASWLNFFDKLSAHPITYIVPLTGEESIHAEAREHVNQMAEMSGKERFLILGGFKGENVEKSIDRAKSHNLDRVQLVMPGFYDRNKDGELELYPPYITAAMHAGRAAFLKNGESATFNYYNVDALELEPQPMQINKMLTSGVACFEFVLGKGIRLVQDITTYEDANDISLYTERSVRILADSFNEQLRTKLEDLFIGKKGSRSNLTSCQNAVISFLRQKIRDEEILSYRNVRVYKEGKAMYVEYEVAPVEPINYVLIKGHFYSETIHV